MSAYYNEFDPYAAAWLRNLIAAGQIAPGDVDERSIVDVQPDDLRGYTQCHFFAGIGGWSLALRSAGWSDERAVWTGSCPCQPYSSAGKQLGDEDERNLWPAFRDLIAERRPPVVFGEQVASKLGRGWLSGVRTDLEALGYGVGGADLCAAGVGAPHIRQRLWWVADADEQGGRIRAGSRRDSAGLREPAHGGAGGGVADAGRFDRAGRGGVRDVAGEAREAESETRERERLRYSADDGCADGGVAHHHHPGSQGHAGDGEIRGESRRFIPQPHGSHWAAATWISCADGKARRVEPGLEPLAHGVPNRVGRLRAYGNAIVPEVAEAFIRAYEGC